MVSSVTPRMSSPIFVHCRGSSASAARQQRQEDLELLGLGVGRVRHGAGLLELDALVDEHRGVAAVVEDHVRAEVRVAAASQGLLGAPPVLLQRLALPGEDRHALRILGRAVRADGDRGRGVVLGREDVAGDPADLGAERGQRLDQHGGLDRHVQRAHDAGALQRLRSGELLAGLHQAGHLVLGQADLLAAELGQGEVGDLEVGVGTGLGGAHAVSGVGWGCRARTAASSFSCFSCSKRSQSSAGTSAGRCGSASNHASTASRRRLLAAQAQREADVAEAEVVVAEQLRSVRRRCSSAGAVEAVAGGGALGLDQPVALDVAQHPRRPARRLGASWMVRASVNAPNLTTVVSRFGRPAPACPPTARPTGA